MPVSLSSSHDRVCPIPLHALSVWYRNGLWLREQCCTALYYLCLKASGPADLLLIRTPTSPDTVTLLLLTHKAMWRSSCRPWLSTGASPPSAAPAAS
jgi:hypothetical protein